jgi:hypothetical protein
MRHLWSLLLALVLTPLIYGAAGVAAVHLADALTFGTGSSDARGAETAGNIIFGLGLGLAAGGLFAVLVMVRLSPVGPLFAGLVYLGVTLYALVDPEGFASLIPADLFGQAGALYRPVGLGTTLLAVPLILTVASPRRWRGPERAVAGEIPPAAPASVPPYEDASVPSAYAQSGGLPTYEPPVYTPPSSRPY